MLVRVSLFWFTILVVVSLFLSGCMTARPSRVQEMDGTTVLWTTASEVRRLCRLEIARACYIPGGRIAIVEHGDNEALEHELKHARCYRAKDCDGHFKH